VVVEEAEAEAEGEPLTSIFLAQMQLSNSPCRITCGAVYKGLQIGRFVVKRFPFTVPGSLKNHGSPLPIAIMIYNTKICMTRVGACKTKTSCNFDFFYVTFSELPRVKLNSWMFEP
jgi:hypothetical protein